MKPVLVALALCLATALPAHANAALFIDKSSIPRADLTDLNLIQAGVSYGGEQTEGAGVKVGSGTWYEIYRYYKPDGAPDFLVLGKFTTPAEGDKLLEAYTKIYDYALWKRQFGNRFVSVLQAGGTTTINASGHVTTMPTPVGDQHITQVIGMDGKTAIDDRPLLKAVVNSAAQMASKTQDVLLLNRNIIHLEGDLAYLTGADGDLAKAPDGDYTLMDHSMMNIVRGHVVWGMPGDKTPGVMVRSVASISSLPN